jgi:hypothetical protein
VLEWFEKFGTWEEKSDFWRNLGNNYLSSSNVFKSLECYDKAYKINGALCQLSPSEENALNKAKLSYNISLAYGKNNDREKSREFAKDCVSDFEKLIEVNFKKYARRLSAAYLQLAWSLDGDTQKGEYYKKSYEIIKDRFDLGDASDAEISDYVYAAKTYACFNIRIKKSYSLLSPERELIQSILTIAKDLADKNPARFDDLYAGLLFDIGKCIDDYASAADFEDGSPETYYLQALAIYNRFLAIDEFTTLYSYAYASGRLGKFYFNRKDVRYQEHMLNAIKAYSKIGDQEGRSARVRAFQYYTVATYYLRYLNDLKNCALAYKKSLDLFAMIENQTADDAKWISYINQDINKYGLSKYLTEEEND